MALTGLTKVTNIGINTTTIPTLGGSRNTGVVTATNFIGDGSGLSGVTGSGAGVIVRDGGSLVGTAGTINFGTNLNVSAISAGIVTVTNAASATALTNLSDVTVSSASNGQILKHNGSAFVNVADTTYSQSSVASGSNVNLRLSDGSTDDDILITAGSNITFSSVSAGGFTIAASGGGGGGGLSNVVEDTTPQLGGSLDLNNKFITGSGGINVSGVTTSTSFVGNITGNVTGNTSGSSGSCTGNSATATTATNVTVSANNSTDETVYPIFVDGATGGQGAESDTGLTYNPSSGNLTATKFTGSGVALTGVVTSIVAGSNITLTGGPTGIVTIAAAGGGSGITDVIQDTTPQLGGNLDLNSKYITGSGGINVTGVITATTFVGNGDFVDLDVDGHTELDNVNIAGVTTFASNLKIASPNGTDTEITESGSGNLFIKADDTYFNNAAGSTFYGAFTSAGLTTPNIVLNGSITHNGDPNTFFGFPGNDQFTVTTANYARMEFIGDYIYLNGQQTGNDRALLYNYASGLGFYGSVSSSASDQRLITFNTNGNTTKLEVNSSGVKVTGICSATSFKKDSGTSSQFLKADGSVDSNTYLTSGSYIENVVEDTTPQLGGNLDLNSKNITGTGNAQIVGVITATSAVPTWTLGASGTDHYTFTGNGFTSATNDPDIYLMRGQRYAFLNNSGGNHPFRIQSDSNSTLYTSGVTNNNATSGYITFNVPMDAPAHLYYKCGQHPNMLGNIYVVGVRINTNGNNRIITGSSSVNQLDGEDEFTYNNQDEVAINHTSTSENVYFTLNANANRRKAILFKNANTTGGCIGLGDSDEGTSTSLFLSAKDAPGGDSPHMVIDSGGTSTFDVGAPGSSNKVIGRFQAESSRNLDIVWHDTGSLMGFDTPNNHNYIFKCNGNEKLRLANDGELFVGASYHGYANRSTLLSVTGPYQNPAGVWTQVGVYSDDGQAADKGGTIGFGGQDGTTPQQQFAAIKGAKANSTSGNYEGYMSFFIRPNGAVTQERVRISSGGQFKVGTGAIGNTNIKGSSGTGNEGVYLDPGGPSQFAISNASVMALNRKTSEGRVFEVRYNGSVRGYFDTNGSSLPSDKNYKTNISDLSLGLSFVNKLKPSQFRYKDSESTSPILYGLIAQDVEESLTSEGVSQNSTQMLQYKVIADDDNESDYYLDYGKLTPVLINAIKELSTEIETLKTKVAALEGS